MSYMKIVIAPDSFKDNMSSLEVCNIIEAGIRNIISDAQMIKIPIADGGEGTCEAFFACCPNSVWVEKLVCGPEFESVLVKYLIIDKKTAVIETASAAGFSLVKNKNPMLTTTYGLGELVLDALDRGVKNIIFGLGGSATNDAGIGMLSALGVMFLDSQGNRVKPTGTGLGEICSIDMSGMDSRLADCHISAACDVDSPLYGKLGAAYTFAGQKGADLDMIKTLDDNLKIFADLVYRTYNEDISMVAGGGAAGGLGAGLSFFLNAELKSGIDVVLDTVNYEKLIENADIIITGEGRMDSQTSKGKVPVGVSRRAGTIPVVAIVGDMSDGYGAVYSAGVKAVFSINHLAKDYILVKDRAKADLKDTVENICRLVICL